MPKIAAVQRQAGYRNALARAYERLDRRDPRELVVRGKGSSSRQPLAAVGGDALILSDELDLPVEPDLVSGFAGARLEIPSTLTRQLIELPHRVRIVRALISRETGSPTVKYRNEIYVCGRLLYTATVTNDASPAEGAATIPESSSSRLTTRQHRQSPLRRSVAANLRHEERAQTK